VNPFFAEFLIKKYRHRPVRAEEAHLFAPSRSIVTDLLS
jgi:hypothetical protein